MMENIGDVVKTTVSKNKTGQVGHRTYKYVDIAQIHEFLESIGARYYQYIDRLDGDDYIMTVKVENGKESQPLRGARVVDATLIGTDNPAQLQGSAITYARRYSLLMAFGLATDDDDAQSLNTEKPVQVVETKASKAQLEVLNKVYKGENLGKLLKANNLEKLEDISAKKAYEIIKKLKEKTEKENPAQAEALAYDSDGRN